MTSIPSKKRQKRLGSDELDQEADKLEAEIIKNDNTNAAVEYRSLLRDSFETLLPKRLQLEQWQSLDKRIRKAIALSIQDKHKFLQFKRFTKKLPIFECKDNLIEFVLIPGGTFTMGLSDAMEEELYRLIVETFDMEDLTYDEVIQNDNGAILASVSRMRPTKNITIQPFLLATTPLLYRQAKTYLPSFPPPQNSPYDDEESDNDSSSADEGSSSTDEKQDFRGVDLSESQLRSILQDDRFRLPSEAEWEYAAREGGEPILFPFGESRIPTEEDLEHRFSTKPADSSQQKLSSNKMNLRGLGSFFELCADIWHDNLAETELDGSVNLASRTISPVRVVRGGALGSWQDCGEWGNMLTCGRHPHSSAMPVSIRLARSLV